MNASNTALAQICIECKFGHYEQGLAGFTIDKKSRMMMVEHVPALICNKCQHKTFEASVKNQLTLIADSIFEKSDSVMFVYQYSDLVRETDNVQVFNRNDNVRIKDYVNTWDFYDEEIVPGLKGVVVGKGDNPFDYIVEFQIGRSKYNVITVEIDEKDLEFVSPVSPKKRVAKASK